MRVITGLQPSGFIHLGNYFGTLRQYVEMQERDDCRLFIADLHALTTVKDKTIMRSYTVNTVLSMLAVGIDPERSTIYRQSDLPEVTEIAWYLSTCTPMGLLERCHSYKEKIAAGFEPKHGLFAYPVLMAADILLSSADIVPVGPDQRQHLEVTRDIAQYFNRAYGPVFNLPQGRVSLENDVPGTDGRKMSKSYRNCIDPFAPEKVLRKQVMSIVTDGTPLELPKDPEQCTVFRLQSLMVAQTEKETLRNRYLAGGYGYREAKEDLVCLILDYFCAARALRSRLAKNPDMLEAVLQDGVQRARKETGEVLMRVRDSVGFIRG